MKHFLLLLFLMGAATEAFAQQRVTLVAENDWFPYSAERHGEPEGMAVDLVRAAYKAAGVELELAGAVGLDAGAGVEVEGELALPRLRERMYSQLMWAQNMLMPWVWRHTLGSSSGKGLGPKRPVMAPLDARPALSEAE